MRTTCSNRLNLENFYQSATPYIFFALFGGFVIYHLALAYRLFPSFLGGYFGVACAITAIFYFFRLPKILQYNFTSNKLLAFLHFSIFIYALMVTILATFEDIANLAIQQSFNTLILWFALFTLGFYFLRSNIQKSVRLNYIFSLFFLGFIIFYIISTKSAMLKLTTISDVDPSDITGYQTLARNLLVISLFLLCYSQKTLNTLFLILSFIFVFFFLGARSEFVAFLLISSLFMLIKTMNNSKYLIVTILSLVGAFILFFAFQESIMESRQFQILDYSDSSSWSAREDLKEIGVKQIIDNPIFGLFGGHVLNGQTGDFIHNSLSAYVNYGLFFYIGYMLISIYATFDSFLRVIKNSNSSEWLYSFLINSACLFLILTTKPVFWGVPFFAWGIYFSIRSMPDSFKTAKHINIKD